MNVWNEEHGMQNSFEAGVKHTSVHYSLVERFHEIDEAMLKSLKDY